jgi:uncharacterized protein (DUF169 family)
VNLGAAADRLTRNLQLESPPVALSFLQAPPAQAHTTETVVPSACSFWRHAERETFYAPAEAHTNCPVGAMVMGFSLSEATQSQLMQAAELMIGCGYLGADEVPNIPTIPGKPKGIAYAPLADATQSPDLVLVWLSPREAMRFSEAAGACAWGNPNAGRLLGRPACAALPTAAASGTPTLSLGCAGMRTFTEISGDRLLGAIPGEHLDDFVAALQRTVAANAQMQAYYDGRKAEVAGQGTA